MEDFAVTNGASFRMVLDVGDWDAEPRRSTRPASPAIPPAALQRPLPAVGGRQIRADAL